MISKNKAKKEVSITRKMALTAGARVRFLVRMVLATGCLLWSGWCVYFGMDSIAWPEVPANINYTADGTNVIYVYQVNGIEYNGNLIRFGDTQFANSLEDYNKEMPPGTPRTVKYDPQVPTRSCLMTGYHKLGVYIPLAIGLFFITVAGLEMRARYLIR